MSKKAVELTLSERLIRVAVTCGVPLACWDFFRQRSNINLFSVIVVMAGNVVFVVAVALIEHGFYRIVRRS
jgi:hypothetical protein